MAGFDIDRVAHLARLDLTAEERELFGSQLETIVAYVERISQLDVEGLPATLHGHSVNNIFRADVPVEGFVEFFNQEYTGKWKASKKSNVNKQNVKYNNKSDKVKDFEFAIKNLLNSKKEHTSQIETA